MAPLHQARLSNPLGHLNCRLAPKNRTDCRSVETTNIAAAVVNTTDRVVEQPIDRARTVG